jgi:hypothetical protein
VQNQITVADRVMIRNKVAGFIITGGQDNIQAVAGQMMMFFGEIGFLELQRGSRVVLDAETPTRMASPPA